MIYLVVWYLFDQSGFVPGNLFFGSVHFTFWGSGSSVGKATQEPPRLKETHIIHYPRKGLETKIVPEKFNGFCRKKQSKKRRSLNENLLFITTGKGLGTKLVPEKLNGFSRNANPRTAEA